VWCVGSSIIKRAFVATFDRPDGISLCLDRFGIELWWQGKGGLVWNKLLPRIKLLLKVRNQPNYLLIHCGANDIGATPLKYLMIEIQGTLEVLRNLLPNTKLIWSQLLPRLEWRHSHDRDALNKTVKRLNSYVAAEVVIMGGYYIKYPDIKVSEKLLFDEIDGVHLSKTGNEIFLNTISGAMERFHTSDDHTYPRIY
ncbi:hypothetical protein FSP39_004921, partial [Pinctada imbricata]